MNVNLLFRKNYSMLNIVLPLGISFFTFQQISFIVDTYHGEVDEYDLLYYASFVTFFPQLIAGPIVTHSELIPQFLDKKRKQINWDNIAKGIYIFTLGLAKKVLLADIFGAAVNWGEQNINSLDTTNAMLVMLGYTFQIYFDFSGYCDMAIGIGKMFNIDLPLNFNSPYKALTINEFWKRWHITLTKFLTKYIYIPLGGNRKGKCCTYFNIIIVFLVSGLWHGASWCFVFWGACHGIFCAITRALKKYFQGIHPALNWIMTFGFINVTWVFFRADSIVNALRLLNRILLLDFGSINENLLSCFKLAEVDLLLTKLSIEPSYHYFALLGFYVIAFIIILGCRNSYEKMVNFHPTAIRAIIIGALMAWCVCIFSNISIFIYYNF